ncbi:GNAT family N-acetyltransferase [Christiangramia sediminis]|uniref:GNAT family N-acetyltransferase n=1 Tax=Christiangramia sediminis TaxID=2881336 RepID=UPI001E3358AE|nr:GNAT family N-acetyltransferase [Christiangramia sediminis]
MSWDSNFFGIQVGKLTADKPLGDQEDLLKELFSKKIDLIYYYSQEPLSEDFSSKFYEYLLVDLKIPVKKTLTRKKVNPKISVYSEEKANEELVQLAQLAGSHTRFKVDPRISEEKFNELFKVWIEKSVSGEMASKVLVYKEEEKIIGFATISIDGNIGYAPLLAVNRKFEGLGVSFAIMDAVESEMYDHGCEFLVSSTQEVNRKALKIYERWGCEFGKGIYVYHFWKKDFKKVLYEDKL